MHHYRPVTVIRSVFAATASAGYAGAFAQASQPAAAAAPSSAPPFSAQIINMGDMAPDEIGPVIAEMGTLRTKTPAMTAGGTVDVQVGTVVRHMHTYSDEIQYMMLGTVTVRLDNASREVRADDLIVIPRDVMHGTPTTSTDLKLMVIKLPPQRVGDTCKVP